MRINREKGIGLVPLILIIVAIIIIGAVVTGIVVINKHKNKEPITVESFKNTMQEKNYEVYDVKDSLFSDFDQIEKAYIAIKGNDIYQIEFYKLRSEDDAVYIYNINKTKFEAYKSSSSIETTTSIGNNSKYTLTTNDKYKVISRVADTAIYLDVDTEYKDEVKAILKELGY